MIVSLKNPSVDELEKTFLSQSYNFGITSIEVRSNLQFSSNQRILIGQPGLSSTEVVTTTSIGVNGTTVGIGATLYPHEADTPIYLLQFDQAKFYRSTTGINGAYSLLPNCPENLDFTSEDLSTTYNDTNTAAGYYYKITVFNSISSVESDFSDPIPAITGWARNQAGYIMQQAYSELSDANEQNLTRDEMLGYMNEVNDDLTLQVVRPYNWLLTRTVLARVAGANSIPWPVDSLGNNLLWKFDRMDYNYIDNTVTPTVNQTTTVTVVDLPYFRNRWVNNTANPAVPASLSVGLAGGGSLVLGKTYYWVVTATFAVGGESNQSNEISATTIAGNLTAVLSWNGVAGASGYNIYRGLSSGGETLLATVTNPNTVTYTDNGSLNVGTQAPPSPVTNQNDVVQEMCLNEAMDEFDYYPASKTSASAVWYLYYYSKFAALTSEGNLLQTPTPKIYKHYIAFKYYLKKAVTEPNYLTVANKHEQYYINEKIRLKGQDRRDVGTPRRFQNEGWVRRSFRR